MINLERVMIKGDEFREGLVETSCHKRTEERLLQSEEKLSLLIESVRDYAIFMLDPRRLYHFAE